MKLNPDCCRAVLLAVEEKSFGEHYIGRQLFDMLPNYSTEDIVYSCFMLMDAGLLDVSVMPGTLENKGVPIVASVNELTYAGHEFLENIRSDNNWSAAKVKAKAIGSFALGVLSKAAAGIIAAKLG